AISGDFESDRQAAFETFASAAQERALIVLGELDATIKARIAETSRVIIDQSLATIAEGAGVRLTGAATRPAVAHWLPVRRNAAIGCQARGGCGEWGMAGERQGSVLQLSVFLPAGSNCRLPAPSPALILAA